MKFLLFSDFHHGPTLFYGGTREHIKLFHRRAEEEGCDFIIHAGDFSFGNEDDYDAIAAYRESRIPAYHTFGNHDTNHTPFPEMLKRFGIPHNYYYFDVKGYRIIAVDTNYGFDGKNYYHFTTKTDPAVAALDPKPWGAFVPPEELAWLERTIATAPGPCLLISHHSFERETGDFSNRADVLRVINEANKRKPHSVLMCMNGHHHKDNLRVMDNVLYFDVNAVTYDWIEPRHSFFPEEECAALKYHSHTLVYNDPLYAIVTVEGTRVKIEGRASSFLHGVTREMAQPKWPFDGMGRPTVAKISSADITLN